MVRPITPAAGDLCPMCQQLLVSDRQAAAWCPACEWNLCAYEARRRRPELGWRWVDWLTHRVSYRLSRRQFAALSGAVVSRPNWGAARLALTIGGVSFLSVIVTAFFGGMYLTVVHWPHPLAFVGLLLVVMALGLRPRLGKLDKRTYVLDKADLPALVRMVERVAAELGTRAPDVIVVDEHVNASCTAVGLRRTRVLTLGLPLWAALPPQQRVALIAHELGHFVNGDLRRGMLTWLPVNTLGELAVWFSPDHRPHMKRWAFNVGFAQMLLNAVLRVVSGVLWSARILALWVSLRDCQRAEYFADQAAARAAGGAAAVGLLDTLLCGEGLTTVLVAAARRGGRAAEWRAVADQNRAEMAERRDRLRQLSVRDEASLFASHPPTGLRARLIESRPGTFASIALTDAESDQIDQELATWYDRIARDMIA